MESQQKALSSLAIRAVLIGIVITALLLLFELAFPASAPRPLAMPGWIAIIFMCGFEGCKEHNVLPWILFGVVNFVAYTLAIFAIFIVTSVLARRRTTGADK